MSQRCWYFFQNLLWFFIEQTVLSGPLQHNSNEIVVYRSTRWWAHWGCSVRFALPGNPGQPPLPGHPGWVESGAIQPSWTSRSASPSRISWLGWGGASHLAFLDIQVGLPFQDILVGVEAPLIGDKSHVTPLNMCHLSLFDVRTDGIRHHSAALLDLWVFIENIQINLILVVIHCGRKGGYLWSVWGQEKVAGMGLDTGGSLAGHAVNGRDVDIPGPKDDIPWSPKVLRNWCWAITSGRSASCAPSGWSSWVQTFLDRRCTRICWSMCYCRWA